MDTDTVEPASESRTCDLDECRQKAEQWVQDRPMDALLTAAGAGFVLSLLPFGKIVRSVLGLAFSLLKPTLLVLGALKLVEEFQANCGCCGAKETDEEPPAI